MFMPVIPFRMLTVFGLEESDLGDWIRPMAAHFGVEVQGDPHPENRYFIRSDQYSFIRRGIPSLFFEFGAVKGSPDDQTLQRWMHQHYHSPSDDVSQYVNLEGAVRFTRLLLGFAADVANRPERPRWKDTSFFRRYEAEAARQ
jgi:Zn-dependent M28 family amino/carboxypeptidase